MREMSEREEKGEEQRGGQEERRERREGREETKSRREALRAFQEGIREGGRRVEEALLNFGVKGFVLEAKVFGMVCGCAGFQTDTRGIQAEEVEVLKEDLGKLLASVGESLGIRPDFIYARKLPGSEEVVALTVRELCEICKEEFAGSNASPRPDIIVLRK